MGNFKFALSMLVKEYKKSIFYVLTMVFVIAVYFVFFNIINNEWLKDSSLVTGGGMWSEVYVPLSTIISFIIICFCCFMIFFANSFFISRKTDEFAIMALSGSSSIKSTMYLIYQTATLLFIATPLGLIIGLLFAWLSNKLMFDYLGVTVSIFYIPAKAYFHTLVVVAMILVCLCVFANGYIYRNDISDLLQQEKAMTFKNQRKLSLPSFVYVFLYVFGVILMFVNGHTPISYVAPTAVGLLGAIGTIKYTMPDMIKLFKKERLLESKYALIYVSNLNYSLQRALVLISIMILSVTGMITVIACNQSSPREYITGVMGYIVIIILLIISIVYKFCLEAETRKTLFFNLWKIGYTKNEIIKIVRNEVMYFYLIVLLIPMVYIVVIVGRFIYYGNMTMMFALGIIGTYAIPILISGIVTYYNYCKVIGIPNYGGENNG